MPVILKEKIEDSVFVLVWQITETESFFLHSLQLNSQDLNSIMACNLESRRLERLACRYALSCLLQASRIEITYSPNGQPLLAGKHISFSHAKKIVAVACADFPIGIDIEKIQDKIVALHSKFVSKDELTSEELKNSEAITRVWTAKEAVYKLFSGDVPDFREQIFVKSDKATVFLHDEVHSTKLFHWKIEEYQCTLCVK